MYYSITGGSTWTLIQTWTVVETANPAIFSIDVSGLVAGHNNVRFKWNYTGTYGNYWALDDISITGTVPSVWTGATSAEWGVNNNWSPAVVPNNTKVVIIPSSASHWPVVTGDLVIGGNCFNLRINRSRPDDRSRQYHDRLAAMP